MLKLSLTQVLIGVAVFTGIEVLTLGGWLIGSGVHITTLGTVIVTGGLYLEHFVSVVVGYNVSTGQPFYKLPFA